MLNQKLIIKEFAQFKDIVIDVNDVLLLIGEQATGKSTLLKWVYFFKGVKKDIINFIDLDAGETLDLERAYYNISSLFSTEEYLFNVKYQYSETLFLEIHRVSSTKYELVFNDKIDFSEVSISDFEEDEPFEYIYDTQAIDNFIKKVEKYKDGSKLLLNEYALSSTEEKIQIKNKQLIEKRNLLEQVDLLFGNNDNVVTFIPAYRGAGEFLNSDKDLPKELSLAETFADYLQNLYPAFDKGFSGLIERKKRLTVHKKENYSKNFEYAEEARKLIENGILKSNYSHNNGSGKLTTTNNTTVSIFNASSGQQETLGMMIVIFLAILNGEATTLFIEEPEVHLYPTAQKTLVDLFCLFLNANEGNKLYLSTHSPYILTSFNNLLYAHQLREKLQKLPPEKQIIKPYYLMDFQRLRAYQLQNGEVLDIRDSELGLIQSENIDKAASQQINGIFDQLFNLENE